MRIKPYVKKRLSHGEKIERELLRLFGTNFSRKEKLALEKNDEKSNEFKDK
jgi:hypothetical protein